MHEPPPELEIASEITGATHALRLESARAMLEQADAAHSPDVRLQFDLGIVDYELGSAQARPDLIKRAVDVLVAALERAPDHPAAPDAMERLVYCYVKLNRPEDELATWHRYIPRLVDDRARAVAMMNMGEAEMRLGHIDDALETFREVLRIVTSQPNAMSSYVLTAWDYAVALDRSGDSRGAVDEASRVLSMSTVSGLGAVGGMGGIGAIGAGMPLPMPASRALRGTLILRSQGVFFVPAWEVEWYFALAAVADARDASGAGKAREAAESWGEAESHWKRYVDQSTASTEHDPWLPIARVRLAHSHAARLAAESHAPAIPKAASPRGTPRGTGGGRPPGGTGSIIVY